MNYPKWFKVTAFVAVAFAHLAGIVVGGLMEKQISALGLPPIASLLTVFLPAGIAFVCGRVIVTVENLPIKRVWDLLAVVVMCVFVASAAFMPIIGAALDHNDYPAPSWVQEQKVSQP